MYFLSADDWDIILAVAIFILHILLVIYLARRKNRSIFGWLVLCLVFQVIGLAALIAIPPYEGMQEDVFQTPLLKEIGKKIALLRQETNMDHKQLARELGTMTVIVSRWEKSEIAPSALALTRLAKVFNVPVDYLLGCTPSAIPEP